MSAHQLKFHLRQTRPMAKAAYLANKTVGDSESFEAWWEKYTARLTKIYVANEKMFSTRDFSDVIPLLIDLDAVLQGAAKSGE